jgi:hypothetical protein
MPAPILFLIFNRSDLTAKVFARIREAAPKQLYIAADGPRASRTGEDVICRETRRIVAEVDWDCQVHHLYRTENLGCKLAVSSAITWFFENVESGIILEDDCLPDPSFFPFCSELLERHQDDVQIGIVGGVNFQSKADRAQSNHSYYFSTYPHIWGWATWRRVWSHYDANLVEWSGDLEAHANEIPIPRVRDTLTTWMRNAQTGETDTWDYQLLNLLISRRQFAVIPWVNLVTNIGFDERATHTTGAVSSLPPAVAMTFPLTHPSEIVANRLADSYTESVVFGIAPNLANHLYRRFQTLLKRIVNRTQLACFQKLPKKRTQDPAP